MQAAIAMDNSTLPRGTVMGFGLDIVDIDDFSRLLVESASNFLTRHFTQGELDSVGQGINRNERLAGRFAVKEAVMKALGVGFGDGIGFGDVEVVVQPTGAPAVKLHRELRTKAAERGVSGWLVTISHTSTVAVAGAIALSAP